MMFDALKPQVPDQILQLIQLYKDDPRAAKIDLGVGVYKDATGLTPVMRAVKAAEKKLWETEVTKTYTGLAGDPAFNLAAAKMILGDAVPMDRVASSTRVAAEVADAIFGPVGGGWLYDHLGSYDLAWRLGVGMGLVAGIVQMTYALARPPRMAIDPVTSAPGR